jgi:quercetin dioxygenase-like cupin family protein
MQAKHLSEAKSYEAPNHRGYCSLRLFGLDAGGPKQFTVGLSHFLPGGGASWSASVTEKVYLVISGHVTVITEKGEVTLGPLDSCHLAPGEGRSIENRGNDVATMAVVISK